MKNYLNFETEIKEIENELDKLKDPFNSEGLSQVNTDKILILEKDLDKKLKKIYSKLNPWQTTLVARHEDRPKAKFFLENIFEDFIQLSGDRFYGEDKSLISGFARFEGKSVLILGQEKGEDLDTRIERNFGMMRPEGYRKNVRLMKLAEKFNIPVISFIDTPGAYPGVGAEERGQAEAIARSIETCMELTVPNISIIIGEGGSGGAIALASSMLSALSATSDNTVTTSGWTSINPPLQKNVSSLSSLQTLTGPGIKPVKSGEWPGAMPIYPREPVA